MGREGERHLTSYGNLQKRFIRHLIQYDARHDIYAFLCMFLCYLSCVFDCLLAFWSRTVRNRRASVCGVGAVVLRAATRPAVVQSAQERPLPLRRYSVGRCARGWESNHQPSTHEQVLTLSLENLQKSHLFIYSDHKRLDYVLEHQVLSTSSETHDVEVSFHFVKKSVFTCICGVYSIARILTVLIVEEIKGTIEEKYFSWGESYVFEDQACQGPPQEVTRLICGVTRWLQQYKIGKNKLRLYKIRLIFHTFLYLCFLCLVKHYIVLPL